MDVTSTLWWIFKKHKRYLKLDGWIDGWMDGQMDEIYFFQKI